MYICIYIYTYTHFKTSKIFVYPVSINTLFSHLSGWLVQMTPTVLDDDWIGPFTQNAPKKNPHNIELSVANHPFWALLGDLQASNGFDLELSPMFSGAKLLLGHNAQHSPQHFGRGRPEMEKSSASECPLRRGIIPSTQKSVRKKPVVNSRDLNISHWNHTCFFLVLERISYTHAN